MAYNRPWKSYKEQLTILKSRGMTVSDAAKAINYLERLGYYRLSGYWYPFREIQYTTEESGRISYQHERFKESVQAFPEMSAGGVNANNMGLIDGWENWTLWQ